MPRSFRLLQPLRLFARQVLERSSGCFFAYFSFHPAKPNAALGFVHALNNHGSYVYLSDAESTGLALLRNVFIISFCGMFAVLPKDPARAPPGTARWILIFMSQSLIWLTPLLD